MIKIKLGETRNLVSALSKLINVQLSDCISFKDMWELTEFCTELSIKSDFFQKENDKLIMKYGSEKNDNTGRYEVLPENTKIFFEEFEKLASLEFEFNFNKIKMKDMEKIYDEVNKGKDKLTMIDFINLKKIIDKEILETKKDKL